MTQKRKHKRRVEYRPKSPDEIMAELVSQVSEQIAGPIVEDNKNMRSACEAALLYFIRSDPLDQQAINEVRFLLERAVGSRRSPNPQADDECRRDPHKTIEIFRSISMAMENEALGLGTKTIVEATREFWPGEESEIEAVARMSLNELFALATRRRFK